jgi:hypothetical protein
VIVEIKSTDWDALPDRRVPPNLGAHIRQLQRYLDVYIDQIRRAPSSGDDHPADTAVRRGNWASVSGVLLYPRRPTDPIRRAN